MKKRFLTFLILIIMSINFLPTTLVVNAAGEELKIADAYGAIGADITVRITYVGKIVNTGINVLYDADKFEVVDNSGSMGTPRSGKKPTYAANYTGIPGKFRIGIVNSEPSTYAGTLFSFKMRIKEGVEAGGLLTLEIAPNESFVIDDQGTDIKDTLIIKNGMLMVTGVRKTLNSIEVSKLPDKTVYKIGESLDVKGGKLTLKYNTGDKTVPMSADMIEYYDGYTSGEQEIKVKYLEKETSFKINVLPKQATSVTIKQPPKTNKVVEGEELTDDFFADMKLEVTFSDGSKEEFPVNAGMITGYDKNKVGVQTVNVNFNNIIVSFEIEVLPRKPIDDIVDEMDKIDTNDKSEENFDKMQDIKDKIENLEEEQKEQIDNKDSFEEEYNNLKEYLYPFSKVENESKDIVFKADTDRFEKDTNIVIKDKSPTVKQQTQLETIFQKKVDVKKFAEIKAVLSGKQVSPKGEVNVSFTIPNIYKDMWDFFTVVVFDKDQKAVDLGNKGKLSFDYNEEKQQLVISADTSELGDFAVVYFGDSQIANPKDNFQTDTFIIAALISFIVVVAAGIGVLIYFDKKRKKNI